MDKYLLIASLFSFCLFIIIIDLIFTCYLWSFEYRIELDIIYILYTVVYLSLIFIISFFTYWILKNYDIYNTNLKNMVIYYKKIYNISFIILILFTLFYLTMMIFLFYYITYFKIYILMYLIKISIDIIFIIYMISLLLIIYYCLNKIVHIDVI